MRNLIAVPLLALLLGACAHSPPSASQAEGNAQNPARDVARAPIPGAMVTCRLERPYLHPVAGQTVQIVEIHAGEGPTDFDHFSLKERGSGGSIRVLTSARALVSMTDLSGRPFELRREYENSIAKHYVMWEDTSRRKIALEISPRRIEDRLNFLGAGRQGKIPAECYFFPQQVPF